MPKVALSGEVNRKTRETRSIIGDVIIVPNGENVENSLSGIHFIPNKTNVENHAMYYWTMYDVLFIWLFGFLSRLLSFFCMTKREETKEKSSAAFSALPKIMSLVFRRC